MRDLSGYRCRLLLNLLTSLMLLVGQFVSPQPAYGKSIQPPELVADEFYGWYLTTLASDKDPFTAEREKLATYVSKDLITEIARQIDSDDGISEDYFLKAPRTEDRLGIHGDTHAAVRSLQPLRLTSSIDAFSDATEKCAV